MNRRTFLTGGTRSVHWWISAALIAFGSVMFLALVIQAYSGQRLVEHRIWYDLLRSVSDQHAARVRQGDGASLPTVGVVRSWHLASGHNATSSAPDYLTNLPPGYHSTEETLDDVPVDSSFHALVVDLPPGRLITVIDITGLENQQNRDVLWTVIWLLALVTFIVVVIAWLYANLVLPIRDLAARMRAIEPGTIGGRLPTTYRSEEIQVIARASNAHLERVEHFVERERSLLDQASHEFRTPIAVIAGAVDVLKQLSLPDSSKPALIRIGDAVEDLSETMVALLYLAREPNLTSEPADVTVLHELLPRLIRDHLHLYRGKSSQLSVHEGELAPTFVAAPEAMVRIAVSNLIRNAIENTEVGYVEVSLVDGVIAITDSGSGFNPAEAARRYRESLRQAAPVRGQGLGIFLINRICDRFGWKLLVESLTMGGTRARLDLTASVILL